MPPSWGTPHPVTGQHRVWRPDTLTPTQDTFEGLSQLRRSSWGWLRPSVRLYCSPTSPSAWSCFFPSPPLPPFPWWWSREHSLINLLHASLHLRVCFLGNLTCHSYYPHYEDGKPNISDSKLVAWVHHLMRCVRPDSDPADVTQWRPVCKCGRGWKDE